MYLLVLVLLISFILILDPNHSNRSSTFYFSNTYSTKSSINSPIDCEEYEKNVSLIQRINGGAVKDVWLGKWSSYGYIAVSFLKNVSYTNDFIHNIHMLRNFSNFNSKYTVQYLGHCDEKILFTKFYSLGSLTNLYHLLKQSHLFNSPLHFSDCFQFCIRYAQVIDYLHNSPIGIRVMCDSNDLAKLASQFLIDNNFNIIANDLDALPDASNQKIQCGNRSLIGDLLAPEQLKYSSYDQQIDIYKMPFLCNYFLSLCPRDKQLDLLVNQLHSRCLNESPSQRPNSKEVVDEYLHINYTVFN